MVIFCYKHHFYYGLILVLLLFYSSCDGGKEINQQIVVEPTPDKSNANSNKTKDGENVNAVGVRDANKSFDGNRTFDPFTLPTILKVKGSYLKAMSVAIKAFEADSMIPESKRNLQNYDVELRANKDNFYVYFSPYLSSEEKLHLGGETSLGKSVMFVITKNDLEIKDRYFFK